MKEIEKNALNMAKKLKQNKIISEVYHPAPPPISGSITLVQNVLSIIS